MLVSYDPRHPSRAVIDTFYYRGGALKVVGAVGLGIALLQALFTLLLA
ncbi:hypothetical protein [Gulosibacter sp. 10]|nr:hypothetical protein [Gulosibacter sp. 10]SJM59590.1 hypothetical protein FM112_06635 [Gulosibacter sp. 10]